MVILREHEAELRANGVESLSLFGSVARGDPYPQDVDLAARLSEEFSSSGLEFFHRLEQIQRRLRRIDMDRDIVF